LNWLLLVGRLIVCGFIEGVGGAGSGREERSVEEPVDDKDSEEFCFEFADEVLVL
jgi:hypothetical protein